MPTRLSSFHPRKPRRQKYILSIPTVTGYWHSLITCMSWAVDYIFLKQTGRFYKNKQDDNTYFLKTHIQNRWNCLVLTSKKINRKFIRTNLRRHGRKQKMDWWISKNDDTKSTHLLFQVLRRIETKFKSGPGRGLEYLWQRPSILMSRDMGLGINPKPMWWSTFFLIIG